jgi:hypothetical protein
MQHEQPQFYATLAGHLSAEDQNMIQAALVKADEEEARQQQLLLQQQAAAAAAAQAGVAPGAPVPGQMNGGAS